MDPLQWMGAAKIWVIKADEDHKMPKKDWSRVDYYYFYQLFGLSFWRHPFTAEDPLLDELFL